MCIGSKAECVFGVCVCVEGRGGGEMEEIMMATLDGTLLQICMCMTSIPLSLGRGAWG